MPYEGASLTMVQIIGGVLKEKLRAINRCPALPFPDRRNADKHEVSGDRIVFCSRHITSKQKRAPISVSSTEEHPGSAVDRIPRTEHEYRQEKEEAPY